MFPALSLLSLAMAALALSGASGASVGHKVEALAFKRVRSNSTLSMHDIIAGDRARIAHFKEHGAARMAAEASSAKKRASYSFLVTNNAVSYLATVGVGSPATIYDLIIDTGSSNTWVGAGKAYAKTSTSVSSGKAVAVSYGSGSFSGTEYTDTVTLSPNLVIAKQSIGVASKSTGFTDADGILGIGPTDLTNGTVSGVDSVPTVTDNLYAQGAISADAIGVYFAPTTVADTVNGELTFGGADTTKYTGKLSYVPVTSTSPASEYWGIDQSITYNGATILSSTAGIVDTGTTLLYLATDAYAKYVYATGGRPDKTTGLVKITATQYAALKPLNFVIGGVTYALTANAQIWPRSLNLLIGGSPDGIYLIVSNLGTKSGEGLDFINGYAFLERFYTVYDTTNDRFGIATTAFTSAIIN